MSRRHLASLQRWDWGFDTGGLASLSEEAGKIRIVPRYDWNGQWCWNAMKSDRLGGTIPHFLIAKDSRLGNPSASESFAVWSRSQDTKDWYHFDNQDIGVTDLEFYNNAPFPSGVIYIAALPLYPFSRVLRKCSEWFTRDNRFARIDVGQATRRMGYGARSAPALPFLGMKITNSSGFTKNKMILTAFSHPSETQGIWQLEGAVEWLIGGSYWAEFILDWFDVYIYPCLNPQGAYGGYFRSQPQDTTKDHNRYWDTTGELECIDAFKTSMNNETGGAIQVGIDFHGSVAYSWNYIDSENHLDSLYALFQTRIKKYDVNFGYVDHTITSMLQYLWRHTYNAQLAFGNEGMCLKTRSPLQVIDEGAQALRVIAKLCAEKQFTNGPIPGSRDFNGATDRIDWASAGNLTGHAMTVSLWVEIDAVPASGNGYLFCIHNSGNASYGIVISYASGRVSFIVRGSTDLNHYCDGTGGGSQFQIVGTGLTHVLITWDGSTDASHVHSYKNGSEITGANINMASETTHTGSWSLGGRIYDDMRNADGRISQWAIWDRVLNATEIERLSEGEAADLVSASGLLFYFKGNTSSLNATPPNSDGTADGTTQVTGVGNGPGIVYG